MVVVDTSISHSRANTTKSEKRLKRFKNTHLPIPIQGLWNMTLTPEIPPKKKCLYQNLQKKKKLPLKKLLKMSVPCLYMSGQSCIICFPQGVKLLRSSIVKQLIFTLFRSALNVEYDFHSSFL